jgi:hypothetical protein
MKHKNNMIKAPLALFIGISAAHAGTIYQAENYTSASSSNKSTAHAGYTGTGFVDFGGNGSWIELDNLSVPTTGDYVLTLRYANGSKGDRQAAAIVNGSNRGNIGFGKTGGWKNWATDTISVPLKQGNNRLRLQANTGSGGPNLDSIEVSLKESTGNSGSATSTLATNQQLSSGQSLTSTNGSHRLVLQSDGNLVIYKNTGEAIWDTKTNGKGGNRFILQGDGNLVLRNSSGSAIWASGTNGKGGTKLVMQDDGNLVLYTSSNAAVWSSKGTSDTGGGSNTPDTIKPVITLNGSANISIPQGSTFNDPGATASDNQDGNISNKITVTGTVNTAAAGVYQRQYNVKDAAGNAANTVTRIITVVSSGSGGSNGGSVLQSGQQLNVNQSIQSANGNYRLVLQTDGNLVLYTKSSQALWSTKTNGKGATRFVIQSDGNLVLYTSANQSVWSSKTNGKGGTKLVIQDDGNLVLLNGSGTSVWSTNTGNGSGGGDSGSGAGGVKIAFIGDTGYGSNFQKVLNLIKSEKAELTIVAGDTSYSSSGDDNWDAMVRNTLGSSDPALVVAGNHDTQDSKLSDVLSFGKSRLSRASNVQCSGSYGEQMTCRYKNIYFVLSSIGTTGSQSSHENFISNSLNNAPNGAWRVCAWHKNQRDMQVGGKSDEVGWNAYETCREKGAIIATGHEHSYERTHLLSDMSSKSVASTSSTFTVSPGKTFAFVSGLGGIGIRDQERGGSHWAKIYTSTQGATYGAMFATFYDDRAEFYFKNISGKVIDQFTVNKGY